MIHEVARFRVQPADHAAFGQALARGVETVLSKAAGYRSHQILGCIEVPGDWLLQVQWETLEAHTVGFRESPAFAEWRAIIGPYFAQPPEVWHYQAQA